MNSTLGYITIEPEDNITSLMWAVMCSNPETVRDIIGKGADVNEVSTNSHISCRNESQHFLNSRKKQTNIEISGTNYKMHSVKSITLLLDFFLKIMKQFYPRLNYDSR